MGRESGWFVHVSNNRVDVAAFRRYRHAKAGGLVMAIDLDDRIVIDPAILVGKPVIRGTRISVEFVIDLLAEGWSNQQILASYPHLIEADISACLRYVGAMMKQERVYPMPV
jgi:uncharacterized protein (DUF433 family)